MTIKSSGQLKFREIAPLIPETTEIAIPYIVFQINNFTKGEHTGSPLQTQRRGEPVCSPSLGKVKLFF